ncbi:RHS repeat-associated core domain-containing protein, partial [Paenibacillus campi]|uniref:RHS repeat domain-containing protein n=1 Tax=Paenibacillus campi TaxID=3106031 RepID=UPI002AFE8500
LNRQATYYDGLGFLRVLETYPDTNGWTRSQAHPDDLGRIVYVVDALGNTQTASYDAWDQQTEFTDAEGNLSITKPLLTQQQTQHYTIAAADVGAYRSNPDNTSIRLNLLEQYFDAYGHKTKVIAYKDGASGHSQPIQESYTYDLVGNVLSYTDPNGTQNSQGVTTAYTYDALNRLTTVQDALNQTSRYTYDGGGGLTSVMLSNPSGKSETLYTKNYNEQGLPTDKIDPTNNRTQTNYNARALAEKVIDRNGTSATYTYDERGQQTSASLQAASNTTLTTGTMQTKSIYGADGNILTDRHELYINAAKVATQTSTSDKLDRITSLISNATDYAARLDASYDALNRVISQTGQFNNASLSTLYRYTKSRLTQIGVGNQATVDDVDYTYTPLGQVQRITFPALSDGTQLQETMTYDALNRLTRLSNTKGDHVLSAYSYQYDNKGNITSVTEQGKDGSSQTSTYRYDKLNRLLGVQHADGTGTQYSYDLRGNRLTQNDTRNLPNEKETSYRYDLQNTLTSVTRDSVKTTLSYLPGGLRWKKMSNNQVTEYSYNGAGQVIGDQRSDGTQSSYVRGDRVLMKRDQTHGKDYYYLYNGHGDVVQMVGTDGSVVNSYQYDEWGNVTQQNETVANELKYAGETYDAETGLYYLKARYYDPNVGRFLNEDTVEGQIDNPLSMNVYTYVYNNPLIYVDRTGHWCESTNGKYSHSGGCSTSSNGERYVPDRLYLFNPTMSYKNLISMYNQQKSNAVSKSQQDNLSWIKIEKEQVALPANSAGSVLNMIAQALAIAGVIASSEQVTANTDVNNHQTSIYRYGNGNNVNLTPRPVKDATGLSYFNTWNGQKATMTTIEAVNATGVLVAKLDNPTTGHVSIMAKDPYEHILWMDSRENAANEPYYLTQILSNISLKLKGK